MNTPPNIAPHIKANDGKIYLLPLIAKWIKVNPPEPGWYPASVNSRADVLRWFDGEEWSEWVGPHSTQRGAFLESLCPASTPQHRISTIYWSTPWWPAAEQARIHAQAIAAGLAIPPGYVPPQPATGYEAIASEMAAQYKPATIQRQQIEAVQAVSTMHPNGTRVHTVGRVIICCLNGPDLRPGVPDGPADQDIDAAIGHLNAMKTTLAKARASAQKA